MPVGPSFASDGVSPAQAPRQGRMSEAIVGQVHGKYYEAASRGNVYAGSTAAAVSPQATLTTVPPILLFNPVGAQKRLAIKKVGFGASAAGTFGTGCLFHCGFTLNGPTATQSGTKPSGGTAITPTNCDIGGANASVATLIAGGTLAAGPLALYPFANLSEVANATIGGNSNYVVDDVDGAIILEPTGGWCLSAISAAITSTPMLCGVMWEEVPVG